MYQQQPLFGDFFNKAINAKPSEPNTMDPNFSNFNKNAFKDTVHTIPSMDEHQIAILIKNNIDEIAQDILFAQVMPYEHLFRDAKFMNGFIRAINSIPIDANPNIRLACNKLTYDYFTSDKPTIPEIKQKCLNISRVVNRSKISELISLGIDDNTASNLALCRYSSMKERVNVQRLNFTLYHKDPMMMNEQMVVYIYEKLFERVLPLFSGIMFEVYPPQQEQEFGETFMEIYGVVSLAILDILNNMPSDKIQIVLTGYCEEWEFSNKPPVRFSLRSLSGDYSRITRVVEYLDSIGKYIP